MNPDVSSAAATVKSRLNLAPGPELDELIASAELAETIEDLPNWARAVLAVEKGGDER